MTRSIDSRTHALSPPPKPAGCELCQRASPLTKHHLIPRTLHNKPRYQKRYSREERLTAIVWLCHPCHKHIHRLYSERELADRFASLEALMSDDDIRAFVDWLATKPAGFKPKSSVRKRH
ncbi:hypothetical protein K1Y77_01710 [Halomonas qaidamensis]|uniref:HNH domain-containing protein n=1 Tax=Halomonas qaidamensis TaxID=2866211 RepID=A0ABY6JQ57_9GAMM|nr:MULTISPECIES: hypothetical protein [Halomonas]UYV19423.1 hypothetical protein K1Y77_01710 [Halomonas qaidamensis]